MPQAVLELVEAGADPDLAVAVAATYVLGFRSTTHPRRVPGAGQYAQHVSRRRVAPPRTDGSDVSEQAAALDAERASLLSTLTELGPDAPTLVAGWSTGDLAAHVAMTEQMRGIPTFLGRRVVAKYGIRLNDTFRPAMALQTRRFRRRGFDWARRRLSRPSPRLLLRPTNLPVSVFEIVVHHEDARRANDLPLRREVPLDLVPSIHWLLRYQKRLLEGYELTVHLPQGSEIRAGDGDRELSIAGRPAEVLLWLSGRQDAADVAFTTEDGNAPSPPHLAV